MDVQRIDQLSRIAAILMSMPRSHRTHEALSSAAAAVELGCDSNEGYFTQTHSADGSPSAAAESHAHHLLLAAWKRLEPYWLFITAAEDRLLPAEQGRSLAALVWDIGH